MVNGSRIEDAYERFRNDLTRLSKDLSSIAGDTETRSKAALEAYQRLIGQAEADRDRQIKDAQAAFEARIAELDTRLRAVQPVSPRDSRDAPTKRAAYSDRTSLLMAKLSMLAYEGFEHGASHERILRRKLEIGGLDLVGTFCGERTQGYVCRNDKLAALVFRGTTDRRDWQTNLRSARVIIKNHPKRVRAHQGFLEAYLEVEGRIVALLAGLSPDLPVYIAGHSLGGALAIVASVALPLEQVQMTDQVAAVYTFGAPRVGGGDFREIVKVPHYRVFNPWDIVPSVPPVWASFQHTGDVRFLAREDRCPLIRKPLVGGLISFGLVRDLWCRVSGSNRTVIRQHDIKEYVVRLDRIARARNSGPVGLPPIAATDEAGMATDTLEAGTGGAALN